MNTHFRFKNYNEDFKCLHCQSLVSTNGFLSGVINRNHCPYCLHSRHLDLEKAGDRLSACKSRMNPVGVTFKKTNNKYGSEQGELMLIHLCEGCGKVAINRIAADDIAENIYAIFEASLRLDSAIRARLEQNNIKLPHAADSDLVRARLFGHSMPAGRMLAA